MKVKSESASLRLARSIAIGVLVSLVFFYSVHVFGKWETESYRPDSQTTATLLLHNTCAVFDKVHTLRPNTNISDLNDGVGGTKLGGSFMNFFDGHILGVTLVAFAIGLIIFLLRQKKAEKVVTGNSSFNPKA